MCINEFNGLKFDNNIDTKKSSGRRFIAKTGVDALESFGLSNRSLNDTVRAQIILASSCWILSFIGLKLTKQKYEIMQQPFDIITKD